MNLDDFKKSIAAQEPPTGLSSPLQALWWDANGDWTKAHKQVDELDTKDGMAVHAYLHRKEGQTANADYWYQRAGRAFYRTTLDSEWQALVEALLSNDEHSH
ncbi:MAG: hypothetical protein ACRD28_02070 [Acidobacteriaceae bacterium]